MRGQGFLALALALGCGPSRAIEAPIALESFEADFASAYCHRVFTCCEPIDVPTASPAADEEACTKEMTANARANVDFLLGFRGVVFDRGRAAHCLDVVRHGACGAVFVAESGALIPCQDIFRGIRAAGERCDDDQECLSARCLGTCQETPAPTCQAGQFLDHATNTCLARHPAGEACFSARECVTSCGCVRGECATRVADGQVCGEPQECLGTCGPGGICRAGYCRGLTI